MKQPPKKYSLKDMLFHKENVTYLAQLISGVYVDFEEKKFIKAVLAGFPERELKQRITWIRECLYVYLPKEYAVALDILKQSIAAVPEVEKDAFIFAPLSDYVAAYGCNKKELKKSLQALNLFTRYCSAEFAIRDFLNTFPKETLVVMKNWTTSKSTHVRRLASEGSRPLLPWAPRIDIAYKEAIPLLDALFADQERYVTRSVANHVNDISKIDPDVAITLLKKWKKTGKQDEKEMNYIISHSLRTLIKKGDKDALALLGFEANPAISVSDFEMHTPSISIGEAIEFSFVLKAKKDTKLMIDYIVTYAGPHKKASTKVFKLKQVTLQKGEAIKITKKHPFKLMSTKRLYAGVHTVDIQINGSVFGEGEFVLQDAKR